MEGPLEIGGCPFPTRISPGWQGEHSLIGGEPHPEQGPDAIVESVMTEAAQVIGAPLLSNTQGAVVVPP